jgi:hypothetical protein
MAAQYIGEELGHVLVDPDDHGVPGPGDMFQGVDDVVYSPSSTISSGLWLRTVGI